MVTFPEATQRIFKNVFVCRRCKQKVRTLPKKIIRHELSCKRCSCKVFRPIKKKTKVAAK